MRACILCGEMSEGSTGKAGMFWPMICQPCKDKEDNALLAGLEYQGRVFDTVIGFNKAGDI